MKTEKEVREEYNQMRNDDPAFAECWSIDDHAISMSGVRAMVIINI